MKKIIIAVTIACTTFSATKAQNILSKVPSSASLAIKYSHSILNKEVSLQKMDTYKFIKKNYCKLLDIDTLTSIQNIGLNFEQDACQYITTEDSSTSFVTLLPLKNASLFSQLIQTTHGANIKIEKKNGFEFLALSEYTYIGWNETLAVIVNTHYQNKKYYYDYYSSRTDKESVAEDTVATVTMARDTAYLPHPEIVKKKAIVKTKNKNAKKRSSIKKKPQIVEVEIAERPIEDYKPKYYIQDSIERAKREAWNQQQDKIAQTKQQEAAENIMVNTFGSNGSSIENELSYKKIIDPTAHISVWCNYETLLSQYWRYTHLDVYYLLGEKPAYIRDTTSSFTTAINIYFEKDKMRMEQKIFSPNPQMANISKELMNSKQNAALANYINPDNIGYASVSINTEAIVNYSYTLLKKYFKSRPYNMNKYADVVDIWIDFLQIIIDEKAIAELVPGNFLFVMHDMKTKLVNYTDYEYDKEFNSKAVIKTKKELSPNFTFIMETKKESFLQRIAQLPVKYAEKGQFNYKEKGGYYELVFDSSKYPTNSLYFMIKEGKAIVTTSKEVIDMTLNNKAFPVDADTKKSILNNNYSLKLNSKKLMENLANTFSTDANKKITDYLMQNLGDLKMESHLKDGMIQSTTTMNIAGNHTNSLEFLFDMIDDINNILEKDKEEKGMTD